jgi:hypothetical protein
MKRGITSVVGYLGISRASVSFVIALYGEENPGDMNSDFKKAETRYY